MAKHTALIEDWMVIGNSLWGAVTKHTAQEFDPDKIQQTSFLISINEDDGVAETENTIYTLGKKWKEKY